MDFREMTDKEYRKAVQIANLSIFSRYAVFTQRNKGWRFQRMDGTPEPTWSVFANHKLEPRQLEMLESDQHPNYIKIWNESE